MGEQPPAAERTARPSGLQLALLLGLGLAVMLVFATVGWAGIVVVIVLYVLAGGVLLSWARWPRRSRAR